MHAKTDIFRTKWGFILAGIGSAVGMGNLWRFPIMVSQFGGLTFLVPYLLFVVLIGATGVLGEFTLGRATGKGPVGAFQTATKLRTGNAKIGEIIGFIPVFGTLCLAIGYTCVMGWIFKYTFLSFSGGLFDMGTDIKLIGAVFTASASDFGNSIWLSVALVISFLISSFGIAKGIEKANKIMMPALFFLLLLLAIYILSLPNAKNGLQFIFTFNGTGLTNPDVWIFAFGQAFFSLSVAGSGSVIYGAYFSRTENIKSSAFKVAFFDTVAAMLAALVILPAMAAGGAELTCGGPGLMFIWLVKIMNAMPGGRFVAIVFFVSVLFAGLSSLINLYEAAIATLEQNFSASRKTATLITAVLSLGVALCIQGIVGEWMDIVSIYLCPLGALLAGIMLYWVAGKTFAEDNVNLGSQTKIGSWWIITGKYLYVPACITALVLGSLLGGIG